MTRPLSSAISTQALERIVDSEESLTSDMDPSKPPSDIGVPSKASSDIEERPKASSDIGITTVGAKIDFATTGSLAARVEAKPGKMMDVESRHRSGSVNVKLPSDQGHTVPVEEAPVDVRVPRKRGKLVRSRGSVEDGVHSYSFMSMNSFEQAVEQGEGTATIRRHRSLFDPEKVKLHSRIEEYRSGTSRSEETQSPKSRPKVEKSRSFACCRNVAFSNGENSSKRFDARDDIELLLGSRAQNSLRSRNLLIKMQTLADLDNISACKHQPESTPDHETFRSRGTTRLDNCVCDGGYQAKTLKYSLSFQNDFKPKDPKVASHFQKVNLSSHQSFRMKDHLSNNRSGPLSMESSGQPKLANVSTVECYNGSILSGVGRDSSDNPTGNRRPSPSAPPPLSNLQIFAISTKPLDVPVTTVDSIPNNVDRLPSLPIVRRNESRLESEKKLSILEPPPPGLVVNREESTRSWNRFLVQLNSILESRAGEFV